MVEVNAGIEGPVSMSTVVAHRTGAFVGMLPEHPQLPDPHDLVVALGVLEETKKESCLLLLGPLCSKGGLLLR